jgi:hypothetical protein
LGTVKLELEVTTANRSGKDGSIAGFLSTVCRLAAVALTSY